MYSTSTEATAASEVPVREGEIGLDEQDNTTRASGPSGASNATTAVIVLVVVVSAIGGMLFLLLRRRQQRERVQSDARVRQVPVSGVAKVLASLSDTSLVSSVYHNNDVELYTTDANDMHVDMYDTPWYQDLAHTASADDGVGGNTYGVVPCASTVSDAECGYLHITTAARKYHLATSDHVDDEAVIDYRHAPWRDVPQPPTYSAFHNMHAEADRMQSTTLPRTHTYEYMDATAVEACVDTSRAQRKETQWDFTTNVTFNNGIAARVHQRTASSAEHTYGGQVQQAHELLHGQRSGRCKDVPECDPTPSPDATNEDVAFAPPTNGVAATHAYSMLDRSHRNEQGNSSALQHQWTRHQYGDVARTDGDLCARNAGYATLHRGKQQRRYPTPDTHAPQLEYEKVSPPVP